MYRTATSGNGSSHSVIPAGKHLFLALTGLAVLWLSQAIATADWIQALFVTCLAVSVVLITMAPATIVLLWLVSGATISGTIWYRFGGLPAVTLDRALLALAITALLLRVVRRRELAAPFGRSEKAMLLFLVIAVASTLVKGGTWRSFAEGGLRNDFIYLVEGCAVPYIGFFLAKQLLTTDRHRRWLLRAVLWAGLLVGAAGMLDILAGISLFGPTRYPTAHMGGQADRAIGTVASPVEFGMLVNAAVLTAVVFLRNRVGPLRRILLFGAVALGSYAAILSKTRSVWISLALGLTVIAWQDRRLRRRLTAAGLIALIALVAAFPLLQETMLYQTRVTAMPPIYNRIVLTATALNMFLHRPIFGFGFGRFTFLEHRRDYLIPIRGVPPEFVYQMGVPHNNYLHMLILTGIVGFLPFLYVLVRGLRSMTAVCRTTRLSDGIQRDLALVALSVFVAYLACSLPNDVSLYKFAPVHAFVLLGAVDGLRLRLTEGRPSAESGRGESAG